MRIIIKNADFSVYGLADIGDLMSEVTAKFGGITDPAPVEAFFRSLGADGSNSIWSKINHLYMPCLGVPADGADALYDVIGKQNFPGSDYTVEAKRGVGPTILGGTIGEDDLPSGMDNSNMSYFCVLAQSARQTLSSSSGRAVSCGGIYVLWEKASNVTFATVYDGTKGASIYDPGASFNSPQIVIVTAPSNGTRTIMGADNVNTTAAEKNSDTFHLSGWGSWVDTAIFAVCTGLTAEDAAIISEALSTFIADFGVVSANS